MMIIIIIILITLSTITTRMVIIIIMTITAIKMIRRSNDKWCYNNDISLLANTALEEGNILKLE